MGGGQMGGDGRQQSAGQRGWREGGNAMNDGTREFSGMAGGANRTWQEGMRALSELRGAAGESPEMQKEIEQMIREMQRLDPARFPGNPELVERIRAQFLPRLEQLELQLRRQVEEQQSGSVRSGAGERIPPGYAEQVADYYRRLSKGNNK